jgi:hypothetical protein
MIKKIGKKYYVVHGHTKKKGSRTDKTRGSVIGEHNTYEEALAQHRAIEASKAEARAKRRAARAGASDGGKEPTKAKKTAKTAKKTAKKAKK